MIYKTIRGHIFWVRKGFYALNEEHIYIVSSFPQHPGNDKRIFCHKGRIAERDLSWITYRFIQKAV